MCSLVQFLFRDKIQNLNSDLVPTSQRDSRKRSRTLHADKVIFGAAMFYCGATPWFIYLLTHSLL